MRSDEFGQFLVSIVVLAMASFTFSAIVTPPDPFSQLRINGLLLPVVLVGSYVLAYRVGVEWI